MVAEAVVAQERADVMETAAAANNTRKRVDTLTQTGCLYL